jgi:RNA polymerase sigma-70 factor (ECF subfamily)
VSEISAAVPASACGPAFLPEAGDAGEAELIDALLRRDRKASEEFISRYSDAVHSYLCRRLLPDEDVVEDCFQQVFLEAWRALPSYRGESGLTSWLLGIARHKVQDHYRDKLRLTQWEEGEEPADSSTDWLEAWDRRDVHARVGRTLESLPEHYRILLIWRYWEYQSAEEMAQRTGKTVKGVERGLARARDHFRRAWLREVANG